MVYVAARTCFLRLTASTDDLHQLRVTSAVPGRVKFELDIKKEHTVRILLVLVNHEHTDTHQNRLNILHGGTIASMGMLIILPMHTFRLTNIDGL